MDARAVVREVAEATIRWRAVAAEMSLPAGAINRMARAFEHDQSAYAETL